MTLYCSYADATVCNITVLEIVYLLRHYKPLIIIINLKYKFQIDMQKYSS